MLSRIAESLYWLGRYTERAEATARILDVYSHALLEDRVGGEESACRRLVEAMGAAEASAAFEVETNVESLVGFFVDDPRFTGSIVRSLEAMWENARGARDAMSSEMWGSINATHGALDVRRRSRSMYAQHGFLGWVRDRAAIVSGLADATMSHDDTWRFIVLGRSLERVDLTVRLLSTRLGDAWGASGWVATLRCCAAYESYLRTYRRGVEGSKALEFLLLDRLFPRSVFHALGAAETVLFDLDPAADRHGAGSEPRRVVGRACADLEFVRVAELERSLPEHLTRLERAGTHAHEVIAKRFFNNAIAISWSA
jgi:uncharacterized alpha-E superfamily protein